MTEETKVPDTTGPVKQERVGLVFERKVTDRAIEKMRLGRHIHFDERSRAYKVELKGGELASKIWKRTIRPFNQGQVGSCTGNAIAGLLATHPNFHEGLTYNEALAKQIYTRATELDNIVGDFPPDDTGSTVLAACKAARDLGLIDSYHWCFGADDVLQTLSHVGPVAVGVNWYTGFDTPKARGVVKPTGRIEGGHAFELIGIDVDGGHVIAENSWGPGWGEKGKFLFSFETLDKLLGEQGEAVTIKVANPTAESLKHSEPESLP
jgi:hypothetical protein